MTTYYSMRVWTKKSPVRFCFDLVKFCIDNGLAFANFDNYGEDGASYRIDIRATAPIPFGLQSALAKRMARWGVLKINVEKWDEPEDVKQGHDIGSKLALRFREFQKEQHQHKFDWSPRAVTFLIALMFEKWWGRMLVPYWVKGSFDETVLRRALAVITEGIDAPWNPVLIERTIHNFLNNLGYGLAGTDQVLYSLMKLWWFAQLERGHDWKTNT